VAEEEGADLPGNTTDPFPEAPEMHFNHALETPCRKEEGFRLSSIASSSSKAAEDQRGPKAHQQQVELFSKLDTKMHILHYYSLKDSSTRIRNASDATLIPFQMKERRIMR